MSEDRQDRELAKDPSDDKQPLPTDRQELLALHQVHVAEYRFQVELNWKRSQYFLALNLAVLVAGGSLLGRSSSTAAQIVASAVFGAGIVTAWLGHRIISSQHEYYRNARESLRRVQAALGLGARGLHTTAAMGGTNIPRSKVTVMLRRTVAVLGVLDGVAFLMVLLQLLCLWRPTGS